ncbi:MAG: glutamate 5-kinase [Gemmataceae bacterium]
MTDLVREEVIRESQTIVVKVGTNVLTDDKGTLDQARICRIVDQLYRARQTGRKVLLVSSGAVGAGVGRLGIEKRPIDLRQLQACAAVGQSVMMRAYEVAFGRHGITTAQILLTAGDFDDRTRYLNTRNTIFTLLEWGVVPIINENDTVSVDEIRFGDNDQLAAMVTNLIQAPLLVLLSIVDGLFTADPKVDPAAKLLTTVPQIDEKIRAMAGDSQSLLGTGGMRTKIHAAHMVTSAGESVIMANGSSPQILDRLFQAEPVGTLFLPRRDSIAAWKRWVGYTARAKGTLVVDAGARTAIERNGKSLLPIGVIRITGKFDKGDVIQLCDPDEQEFARGLINYSSADTTKLAGLRTDQLWEVLGVVPYAELVHRDNLVVLV